MSETETKLNWILRRIIDCCCLFSRSHLREDRSLRCVGFGADLVTGGWFSIVGSLDGSVDGTKIVLPRLRAIQQGLPESVIGWVRTDAIEQGVDPCVTIRCQYHGQQTDVRVPDRFYEVQMEYVENLQHFVWESASMLDLVATPVELSQRMSVATIDSFLVRFLADKCVTLEREINTGKCYGMYLNPLTREVFIDNYCRVLPATMLNEVSVRERLNRFAPDNEHVVFGIALHDDRNLCQIHLWQCGGRARHLKFISVDAHRVRYQEMQRVFGYPLYHGLREYPLDQDTNPSMNW